jgi:hypothetical protein
MPNTNILILHISIFSEIIKVIIATKNHSIHVFKIKRYVIYYQIVRCFSSDTNYHQSGVYKSILAEKNERNVSCKELNPFKNPPFGGCR